MYNVGRRLPTDAEVSLRSHRLGRLTRCGGQVYTSLRSLVFLTKCSFFPVFDVEFIAPAIDQEVCHILFKALFDFEMALVILGWLGAAIERALYSKPQMHGCSHYRHRKSSLVCLRLFLTLAKLTQGDGRMLRSPGIRLPWGT
jgi:hypothetical protein